MPAGNYSMKDIVRDLEDEILSKKLARGIRLSTGLELSHRYGVSSRTIDRAMCHLSERGLIERIPGKGTFVLSNTLSFLSQKVCLLTCNSGSYQEDSPTAIYAAYDYLQSKLSQTLTQAGYQLDHLREAAIDENQHPLRDRYNSKLRKQLNNYDLIVMQAGERPYVESVLRTCKAQTILFMDDVVHPGPWNQIVYDYRPGFRKALQLFQRIHCEKIISVGFSQDETSAHRLQVFHEEALALGYKAPCLQEKLVRRNSLSRYISGQEFADFYLRRQLFDHAIFCSSDFLMIGMMLVFRKHGLVPGRDFQLISYDNFEGRMKNVEDFKFGITSITHPQDTIVEALKAMVQNLGRQRGKDQFYQTYFVPAQELVIRQSTQFTRH